MIWLAQPTTTGRTSLKWTKGHNGNTGNEEADKLAKEGASKPLPTDKLNLTFLLDQVERGVTLSELEQKDFYRIILERKPISKRTRAERNVGMIQACAQDTFNTHPTTESIWIAAKHKDFTRKTRDFMSKSMQNAYKIGKYWGKISNYENRETCPICNEREDMEHILTKCQTKSRITAWNLANNLWKRRHNTTLPTKVGNILGCGLAAFRRDNQPDQGKNRLYRILVSETAFLVWKMRNERRIAKEDAPKSKQSTSETYNR